MTAVRKATVFFSALVVIGFLGMVYGIVRPELAVGVLGALGVPIALWLVASGVALGRDGVTDASPLSSSDTARRYAWWVLPAVIVVLFVLNLAATADISRGMVVGAEAAGLAAGTACVLQMKRRQRT